MYQMLDKAELEGKSRCSPRERQSSRSRIFEEQKGRRASTDKKEQPKDQVVDGNCNDKEERYRKLINPIWMHQVALIKFYIDHNDVGCSENCSSIW